MAEPAESYLRFLKTPSVPDLGPGPRRATEGLSELTAALDQAAKQASLPSPQQDLVRALILLWHDHLDAAHQVAQAVETAEGSYVHALVHRREPDFSNAKYWFRRVGTHPCYVVLAERAGPLLGKGSMLASGKWDPFAFVDACERTERGAGGEREVLREIQAIEFEVLLNFLSA